MFPFLVAVLTVLILIDFFPLSQERCHWLKYVGLCIIIAKFDVANGASLSVS